MHSLRRLREVVGRRAVAFGTCDGIAGLACRLDRLFEPERPGEREAEPREEAWSPDVLGRHEVQGNAQERRRVVVGVRRLRRLCGGERGRDAALRTRHRRAPVEVVRDVGDALGAALFHRLRDPAVEADLPRRVQLRVERVADERVGEVIRVDFTRRAEELGRERLVERVEGGSLVDTGRTRRDVEAGDALEGRRHRQEPVGDLGEP